MLFYVSMHIKMQNYYIQKKLIYMTMRARGMRVQIPTAGAAGPGPGHHIDNIRSRLDI